MRLAVLLLLLLALPAAAQTGLRATDTRFTGTGLADALSGNTVEFFDGSLATYRADARYEYRYAPGDPVWRGTWEATASEVCVAFDNGRSRCDTFVRADDRLVLVIERGDRFPVRTLSPED